MRELKRLTGQITHSGHGVRTNLLFTMSYRTGRRPEARCKPCIANDCYHPLDTSQRRWWSRTGSNRRHPACKAGALPAELRPLIPSGSTRTMVGLGGLEPPTSRLSSARSNQLSYKPLDRARQISSASRQASQGRRPRAMPRPRGAPAPKGCDTARERRSIVIREERETKAADPA